MNQKEENMRIRKEEEEYLQKRGEELIKRAKLEGQCYAVVIKNENSIVYFNNAEQKLVEKFTDNCIMPNKESAMITLEYHDYPMSKVALLDIKATQPKILDLLDLENPILE